MSRLNVFVWGISMMILTNCASQTAQNSSEEILLETKGWKINPLEEGLTHYELPFHYLDEFKSYQNVNVLAVDLKKGKHKIHFYNVEVADSVSSVAHQTPGAIAAINGTYYEKRANSGKSTSFSKSNGVLIDSVEAKPGTLYYWKHEGAFYMDGNTPGIIRGGNSEYKSLKAENIMSGSPLLIENYHLSGTHFARNIVDDITKLEYENPDRHQGVRHPRTAVAILPNDIVLFVTVDGRNPKAEGMSAKELTLFLKKYFNPKDALNMDGGGSTTFWLKDSDRSETGVINYPTDNKKSDHYGQRRVRNGFIITN